MVENGPGGVWGSMPVRVVACSVLLGAVTVTALLPLCDLLFGCGCTWPSSGGIEHCNIFEAGLRHCPWCIYPRTADLSLASMLFAQTLGAWAVARRRGGLLASLACGTLCGAAVAVVARSAVAWWADYPL